MTRARTFLALLAAVALALPSCSSEGGGTWPGSARRTRYVFLFIGDGMAAAQVHAAEAYLANQVAHDDVGGSAKAQRLGLSTLPVQGMASTSPWNALITDSAAAATAMATGHKTADGVVSMDPSGSLGYRTIAEAARAAGLKVGIVTSVSIDHATPAAFYAHQPSRNDYHAIGHDLVASGFDYFGGGGLLDPDGTRPGAIPRGNVLAAARDAGYQVADTRAGFEALSAGGRAIAVGPVLDGARALYHEIDRVRAADPEGHIALAEFTQKGIDLLQGNPAGFFLMVEGGKIDWACHANDARTAIDDTIALDDAVKKALRFQAAHPDETLVVVTGDHETGGLSLGWAGTGYGSSLERLESQQVSFQAFAARIAAYKAGAPAAALEGSALADSMRDLMGLDYASLTPFERRRLEAGYARAMLAAPPAATEEELLLYGAYDPLGVTITHLLDNRSGLGWTSYSHTAVPVPVRAGGPGAEAFGGFYENSDIALKLAAAMQVSLAR